MTCGSRHGMRALGGIEALMLLCLVCCAPGCHTDQSAASLSGVLYKGMGPNELEQVMQAEGATRVHGRRWGGIWGRYYYRLGDALVLVRTAYIHEPPESVWGVWQVESWAFVEKGADEDGYDQPAVTIETGTVEDVED